MKRLIILFVALSLSGCMSLPFNPFSDDGGIEVEAQIGKTNEKVTGVKAEEVSLVKKETTAEFVVEDSKYGSITATGNIQVDEQVPVWVWLLAILGWLLPSPQEIWSGLGKLAWSLRKFFSKDNP